MMSTELKESEVSALRRACECLHITVDSAVADDVRAKAEAVIAHYADLLAEKEAEVIAVLNALGTDAVRVHEDGGSEDIYASLAVSTRRLQRTIESLRANHATELQQARREGRKEAYSLIAQAALEAAVNIDADKEGQHDSHHHGHSVRRLVDRSKPKD